MSVKEQKDEVETTKEQIQQEECCICFEELGKTNITTTPCGHIFCFKCIIKCLDIKNTCPYCRVVLKEESIDNESDEDTETSSESSDSDSEVCVWNIHNTSNPITMKAKVKDIHDEFIKKGITMENLISIFCERYDDKTKYKNILKVENMLSNIIRTKDNEKKNEWNERLIFMKEDKLRNLNKLSQNIINTESDFNLLDFFAIA